MYCFALSFLALVILSSSSTGAIEDQTFGTEYVYRYRGHVSAGFPQEKSQYASIFYDVEVQVQPKGEYALFKIKDKNYKAFYGETKWYESQRTEYYNEFLKHDPPSRAFKVYFHDGKVSEFQVHQDEPVDTLNLKRALISLFHLTFHPTEPENLSDREKEIYKPEYGEHYYKVMEDGLLGECETQYVIEHLPYYKTPHNNIVLNVTKTRNYQKCTSVPNHYYSTFYGEDCSECEREKAHTVRGNAFYHYDIRGDRHNYVIEKVTTEGKFVFQPYSMEGQTVEIFVNRSLELIYEYYNQTITELNISADLKTHHSLQYDFDYKPKFRDEIDLKKPHYLYHIYGKKVPLEQIRQQVTDLIRAYDDETYQKSAKTREFPAMFLEMVRSVSTLGYDEIAELYKEYGDFERDEATPEKVLAKNLFFDVLVNTGTNPVLLFGKNLVKAGKVPQEDVLYFLQQMPYHVKEVTQTLLDEAYALCRDEHIVERPRLYTACYLALANIIHDRCVARFHLEGGIPRDEYSCPEDVPHTFFNEITKKYEESEDEYRKIAYITALGELGVKESLRYLMHYVEGDAHQNLLDRTNAIYALFTIARHYPELVRELIIPLYYNTTENYEVRLAAFNVLLRTHPHLYELETIARNLIDEKDDQVRSYVYSAFKSYENSTYPCDLKLARDVRYALRILELHHEEFDRYDYSYSHYHYTSGFNKRYNYGGFTKFTYMASDTGYIPRSMYLQMNHFLRGKSVDTFAIGFKQYGLEKFADRLLGPEGVYGKRSLFDLFKRRKARDVSNTEKERQEIQEKLHLPTRHYEHLDGEIFFNYMGNHYSFMYFNESTFESFFREGEFEIPDVPGKYKQVPPYKYKRFMMPVDLVYLVPSEMGLPIIMDFKQPTYFYHRNDKTKLEVNPAFFKEDRQDQQPTDLHVDIEGHFMCDKQFIGTVGVVQRMDHMTFGAGVEKRSTISLPIRLEVAVDLKETKVEAKLKPVVPHQIYHFEFEPYTFIDLYDDNFAVVDGAEYRPVRRRGYQKLISKEFNLDSFGLKLHVDKDFDNEFNDYGSPFRFLVGENFREKLYYLTANPQLEPYKYNVTLDNADGEAISEVDARFSYSFYRDDNRPDSHLSENGFEEYGSKRKNKNFLTSVLHAEIEAHGDRDHKVQAELTYSRDIFRKYHKLHFYYDRTPFFSNETEHLKVCVSGYLNYTNLDDKYVGNLERWSMERPVETEVKAHFGKDCSSDQKITIQGRFEKSDEQLYLERHRYDSDASERYNRYAYMYQKCYREQGRLGIHSESCLDYIYQSVKLNKYTFDVHYEHLSPRFFNFTHELGQFLQRELYYSHTNESNVHSAENEYHLEFNVSSHLPVADIRVRRPHSQTNYTHVYVPFYRSFPGYPFHQDAMTKKSLNNHFCKVTEYVVRTFDRYTYDLPPIDCYKIIAKDCSERESFIVLSTRIVNFPPEMATKVLLGKHKIEIMPISAPTGHIIDFVITVDGKKVSVTEEDPYYHYEQNEHRPDFFVAYKEFYCSLYSEKYGIIVETDGHFITVQVSPYYRSKLCGLCGNYNGQKYDGYLTNEGCLVNDDQAYAYSFVIPTETCVVPKFEFLCNGKLIEIKERVGCTELKTEVLQITKEKEPQTCFSTEPVPHCREMCKPTRTHNKTVPYHCLPTKDDSTGGLIILQQYGVLYKVHHKSHDHEAEVEVSEHCHRP